MATDVNTLTFGIEIETCMPMASLSAHGWSVGSYCSGAAIPNFPGWQAKTDASIQADYPNAGVEVVSPILQGVAGLLDAQRMVRQLQTMAASVNRSTGFHVHVGWNGNANQLRRLICLVAQHEKALFASTGTIRRENNTYTRTIKNTYKPLERMRRMSELSIVADHQSRYHTLNLHNLAIGRRTVEFRVFAGTLNFTKIAAYISLCLGLVIRALDGREFPKWDYVKTAKQAQQKDGSFAMMRLMCSLCWRQLRGQSAMGVMEAPGLPSRESLRKTMLKMARKYDEMAQAQPTINTPQW